MPDTGRPDCLRRQQSVTHGKGHKPSSGDLHGCPHPESDRPRPLLSLRVGCILTALCDSVDGGELMMSSHWIGRTSSSRRGGSWASKALAGSNGKCHRPQDLLSTTHVATTPLLDCAA